MVWEQAETVNFSYCTSHRKLEAIKHCWGGSWFYLHYHQQHPFLKYNPLLCYLLNSGSLHCSWPWWYQRMCISLGLEIKSNKTNYFQGVLVFLARKSSFMITKYSLSYYFYHHWSKCTFNMHTTNSYLHCYLFGLRFALHYFKTFPKP